MQFTSREKCTLNLKITVLILSLILALISTTGAHANPKANKQQLSALVLKAQHSIDDYNGQGQNLEKAGELLVKAAQLDDTYAPIYVEAARLTLVGGHIVSFEFTSGTLENAEALLKKAESLDPKNPDTYVLLGHVYRLMGKHKQAFVNLSKASELKADNPWLLNNFGAYYEDLQQVDTASSYYTKAVEKGKGKSTQQRNSYIDALLKLQWFAALKDDNKNVLKFGKLATDAASPTDAWTWGNVGNILFIQGYFDDAERHARKALGIMNYGVGRGVLALALYGKWAKSVSAGHAKQAEPLFEEAYRLNPDLNEVIGRFNGSASFMKSYIPLLKGRQTKLLSSKNRGI